MKYLYIKMKMKTISLMVFLSLIICASGAIFSAAETQEVRVGKIRVIEERITEIDERPATVRVYVNLENILEEGDAEDVKVTVTIPHLGLIRRAGPFDVEEYSSKTLYLRVPQGKPSGVYDARIVVSNDDFRRVKHRRIIVE